MNQFKQVAEIQNIKGNEKMLLNFAGFENIYQAKKESHLNAPAIYAYLLKEVNDKIKKENEIKIIEFQRQAKNKAIKKVKAEIEKVKKEIKIKEEVKRIKKEAKQFIQIGTEGGFKILKSKLKQFIPLGELGTKILKWNQKNNKSNQRFSFTMSSAQVNAPHTFKFNHIIHFENWYKKLQTDLLIGISESWGNVFYAIQQEHEVWDTVLIENIKIISGGCNKHHSCERKLHSSFYDLKLFAPTSMGNNCLFKAIENITGSSVDIKGLRKKFNLPTNTPVSINDAYKIFEELNTDIQIIDAETNEELDHDAQYIIFKDNHYSVLTGFEEIVRKDNKTKRGLMTFDFETRPTEEYNLIQATKQKMFILKDTICDVYYRKYKSEQNTTLKLTTNSDKSSARQFIDFLNEEAKHNRSYNVLAHNGGKFDFYFLISSFTEYELLECELQFRGITIIGINYRGNLFKDSCCFLTDTLESLSNKYKVDDGKMTSMVLHGKEIKSTQLCFYKPELTFNEFLALEQNDPEFWELYHKYCVYDCIALFQIWEKFTVCINGLIQKINPFLLRSCPLMSSNTIGSHSKKILVNINKFKGQDNTYKQLINQFLGITYKDNKVIEDADMEKYKFLCNFKRGGISHCNKAGKHLSGITGVDIASQYPASLEYCYIPCGKSEKTTTYDKSKHGFYHLKNCMFDSFMLKPVAESLERKSLNWSKNNIDELFVDSYMLEYLINNYGLKSFDVVEGLVSDNHIEGKKIFGKYINTFYEEKKLQDQYKDVKSDKYNEALRSTIKLYLNSLTGKLVEDPSSHFSMEFNANRKLDENHKHNGLNLNGQNITKEFNTEKYNDWITCGIMVYSYSKRLLFEYIKCLPNNSDDVIHIETDGIYFSTRHLEAFTENLDNYVGDYPCKMGEDLGNLKIEKSTPEGQVSYFLGKKFYNITLNDDYLNKARDDKDKSIYRIKGIPQKTINDDGSNKWLVDTKLYDDLYEIGTHYHEKNYLAKYENKFIKKTFKTLKKTLWGKTSIATLDMTRVIKPNCAYKLFE
jgi:hypothetical protein